MSQELNVLPKSLTESTEYRAALAQALKEANAPLAETANAPVIAIQARPTGYWNNTGIYKPKGITLLVSYVSGTWRSNPYWGPVDGAGNSQYIAGSTYLRPGAPEGALIAKIGGDHSGGGSETFAIGNYGFVRPELEGLLWLTVNDEPRGFGDNQGSLNITVNLV